MSHGNIYAFEVLNMIHRITGHEPDHACLGQPIRDFGIDSLDAVGLAMEIEERWPINIEDFDESITVTQIGEMIAKELADAAAG